MADEFSAAETTHQISKEQKTAFVLLLIFSILGLTLGVLQMRNTMLAPFALTNDIPSSIKDQIQDVSALKYRDTDKDGLSDYDELYTYNTSPYLYDTYGYGMSDKQVIEKGLALCANAGKDCSTAESVLATPSSASTTAAAVLGPAPEDINAIIKDPKAVRKLMLDNGADKTMLDKVSDTELMGMVEQLIASSTVVSSTP